MRPYMIAYGATLVVMVALDACWLTIAGRALYRPKLGDMLLEQPVWTAAVLFYLVYAVGVVVFVVSPALGAGTWTRATLLGALLGCVAYATYDLTNHATLRNWSGVITVVDIIWGAVLTAIAGSLATIAASRWG